MDTAYGKIQSGMNLDAALKIALDLGLHVEKLPSSGHVRVSDPTGDSTGHMEAWRNSVTVNCRRKTATRPLTTMLRRKAEVIANNRERGKRG